MSSDIFYFKMYFEFCTHFASIHNKKDKNIMMIKYIIVNQPYFTWTIFKFFMLFILLCQKNSLKEQNSNLSFYKISWYNLIEDALKTNIQYFATILKRNVIFF